jgi:propionyl-CoA carboxylase alpha chain
MIAKLCTWAPDRIAAIDAMGRALDDFELEGIGHNLPFLAAIMRHPRFREGRLSTAFIAEEFPGGFAGVAPDPEERTTLAAIALFVHRQVLARNATVAGRRDRRRPGPDFVVALAGEERAASVQEEGGTVAITFADGRVVSITSDWRPGLTRAIFTVDGRPASVKVAQVNAHYRLRWRGIDVAARAMSPRIAELSRLMPVKLPPDTSRMLLCPMPGIVTSIAVGAGDNVEVGQTLATVEAMKMENVLRAERKGIVKRVAARAGASLGVDELILEFE